MIELTIGAKKYAIFSLKGYLGAAIFEKKHWTFGQSLILNVNSHIFLAPIDNSITSY